MLIEVDRGAGWIFLATDSVPDYIDTHALPATPTKWKYRAVYRLDGWVTTAESSRQTAEGRAKRSTRCNKLIGPNPACNQSLAKRAASRKTGRMFAERMAQLGIRAEDLVETFARSSGPGGQHVNKVSTAVTLVHKPSSLRVVASDSRSQSMNRKLALERLLDAFERRKEEKRQSRLADISKARRQKAKRSRGTKRKLVEGKRKRGETKKLRGRVAT